jgi:hypothetical protein
MGSLIAQDRRRRAPGEFAAPMDARRVRPRSHAPRRSLGLAVPGIPPDARRRSL